MRNPKPLKDIFNAYYAARKNKRGTANQLRFEIEYEKNLFRLYDEIVSEKYEPSKSIAFIVNKPVKREIFAADFRDRVVHHFIFNSINSIFERNFIKDSYSCRVGKGTSYGIKRADHFIRSCSENYQKNCWILKLDIQGYFMSIDKNILYEKIESKLKSSGEWNISLILYLIRKIIFHDPIKNCIIKGEKDDWVGLPKSKSLFFAKENRGLPIGNLTSQLFGNIYLDEFDHFVKKILGVEHYGRYVDDMIFVHQDKKFLKFVIAEVKKYLKDNLDLDLHPKKIYLQYYFLGVKFLGAYIKPYRIYINKRTKGNFYAKIRKWNKLIENRGNLRKEELEEFIATVNSYLGMMGHYNTYKLRKKMLGEALSDKFFNYIEIDKSCSKVFLKKRFLHSGRAVGMTGLEGALFPRLTQKNQEL